VLTHQHHISRKTGTAWWGDFSELQIQIKQKSQFEFCIARYPGIQTQSKSQLDFVPSDTEKFEFLDFD